MSLCHDYLLARGVLPETAAQYGFELDEHPTRERIVERLRADRHYFGVCLSQAVQELLWAPVDSSDGARLLWCARVFLLAQYGQPDPKMIVTANQYAAPFIWRPVWEHVRHTDIPLIITEGPVKGLVVLQAGGFPIALHGVWMGAQDNGAGSYELIAELAQFDMIGRAVYLAFDADQASNSQVLQASIRQAFLLFAQGADVRQLTTWDPAQGKGIDDYLAGRAGTDPGLQREVLADLVTKAPPFFETIKPSYLRLVETELRKIALSPAQRSQLCKLVAKPLGVKVGALDIAAEEEDAQQTETFRLVEKIEPWP